MNIDNAIEILDFFPKNHPEYHNTGFEDALKLGIEALKRIQIWRDGAMMPKDYPLQGETKD